MDQQPPAGRQPRAARAAELGRCSPREVIAVVLAAAVLAAGGWLVRAQFVTNDRLDQVAADQDRLTREVLCPLFVLQLSTYDPNSQPAGPVRDRYVETFDKAGRLFARLRCTAALAPPQEGRS